MARIGLNNLWYSHLTEAADGTPSYDGKKSFGKAISANASISNNDAKLYADDALAEADTTFQSGTITLGVDDDRETVFADVLGHTVTAEGIVKRNANDVAPWVGLARIIVKMVNNVRSYKVELFYKVKFAEPSQDDQTKGESVEFKTPEIEGQVATLANGDWSDSKVFTTKAAALAYIDSVFGPTTPVTPTFTVTYDVNGGEGEIEPETCDAGDSITTDDGSGITAPSGKTFDGWALTDDAESATVTAGASFTPTGNTILYAVYTAEI